MGLREKSDQEEEDTVQHLRPLFVQHYDGGNLVVDLDEEDYWIGVEELKKSVVEKLFLLNGSSPPKTMELKAKLKMI